MAKTPLLLVTIAFLLLAACDFPRPGRNNKKSVKKDRPFAQIVLKPVVNKKFTFSNKISGFYLGNTHRANEGGFDGWTVDEYRYLTDYRLFAGERELRRNKTAQCLYYPFSLIRRYKPGLQESFTLLDSVNAILIEITHPKKTPPLKCLPVLPVALPDSALLLDARHPFRSISARKLSRLGGTWSPRRSSTPRSADPWRPCAVRAGRFRYCRRTPPAAEDAPQPSLPPACRGIRDPGSGIRGPGSGIRDPEIGRNQWISGTRCSPCRCPRGEPARGTRGRSSTWLPGAWRRRAWGPPGAPWPPCDR